MSVIKRIELLNDLGRYEECIKKSKIEIASNHSNEDLESLYVLLVDSLYRLKLYDEAQEVCLEGLQKNPLSDELLLQQVLIYRVMYKLEEAKKILDGLILKHPNKSSYYNLYSVIYYDEENFKKAKEMILKALKISPNESNYKINLAMDEFCLGNEDESAKLVNEVLKEDPHFEPAINAKQGLFIKSDKKRYEMMLDALSRNPHSEYFKNDIKDMKINYIVLFLSILLSFIVSLLLKTGILVSPSISIFILAALMFILASILASKKWMINLVYISSMIFLFFGFENIVLSLILIGSIFVIMPILRNLFLVIYYFIKELVWKKN